jgi:subtilisin family serine protease
LAARVAALGGNVIDVIPEVNVALVGKMTDAAAKALAAQQDVDDVTQDEPLSAPPPVFSSFRGGSRSGAGPASVADPTTAIAYPYQWNMRVIEADQAWAAGYLGSPDVRIAIIDTGIDPTHPDMAGMIDPSRSISLCPAEDALVAQEFPGYPLWTDLNTHGTWVASMAASKGVVVAGVTSRTTLMAVKLFGIGPCSGIFEMIKAFAYATNNGADVINASFLGGPTPWPKAGQKGLFHYQMLSVRYALQKGVSAVVAAAGNQATDLDHQVNNFHSLCDIPGVICVSATGPTDFGPQALGPWVNPDTPGFYSNFGAAAIDVAAPGGNLSFDGSGNLAGIGTLFGACATTMRRFDAQGNLVPGICPSFGFLFIDNLGTSGAAPHVSGLAALLVSRFGRGSAAQVKSAIENSADDLGKPGVDPFYGHGRINVPRALGIK